MTRGQLDPRNDTNTAPERGAKRLKVDQLAAGTLDSDTATLTGDSMLRFLAGLALALSVAPQVRADEPNKVLTKGFEALGASPMPPMGLILKPQELADTKAYLQTLK